MKKALALILAVVMCLSLFAACGNKTEDETNAPAETTAPVSDETEAPKPAELKVVTMFGGEDAHTTTYLELNKKFEADTGNTIVDQSAVANDDWKVAVTSDFTTGNIPDVLFFFNGPTAADIVKSGHVIDLATIQAEYPDYAANIGDGALKCAANIAEDGKTYCVPIKGFAEGLYVNKNLFADNGLSYPKTWDEFMNCVNTFAAKGIVPISAAMGSQPHYWFEHLLLAAGGCDAISKNVTDMADVPASWTTGFGLCKTLYDAKAFPADTATLDDGDGANMLFKTGAAAMYIDGSWFNGQIPVALEEGQEGLITQADVDVIPMPTMDPANYGNIVAGFSSGWYVTDAAWNDPDKKAAAMAYVQYMTSGDAIAALCGPGIGGMPAANVTLDPELGPLAGAYGKLIEDSTNSVGPMQDNMAVEGKNFFIANMINLCTGDMTVEDFIAGMVEANAAA